MSIIVRCTCGKQLRFADDKAGKQARCPYCQAVLMLPSPTPYVRDAGAIAAPPPPPNNQWYMQGEDGHTYGPVVREQLDIWFADGRITAGCCLWQPGNKQMRYAADVYPQLSSRFNQEIVNGELVTATHGHEIRTRSPPLLTAAHFRHEGETPSLLLALGLLAALLVIFTAASLGIMIAIIVIGIVLIGSSQSQLLRRCRRIGGNAFVPIQELSSIAAARLQVPMPAMYVIDDPRINACAIGFMGPASVVLNTGLLEVLDRDELLFVIGHEMAHVKCGHTNWLVFTRSAAGVLNNALVRLLSEMFFRAWSRKSEFTCDRGGLLACRSPQAAVSALACMEAGQRVQIDEDCEITLRRMEQSCVQSSTDLTNLLTTHPDTIARVRNVLDFSRSNVYRMYSS